jgi:hypothetical protein
MDAPTKRTGTNLPANRLRKRHHLYIYLAIGFTLIAAMASVYIGRESGTTRRDALDAFQGFTEIAVLIGAAILSYDKFFRGRAFVSRADLTLSVTVIDTNSSSYLHAVLVTVKNVGTSTIWNPVPQMRLQCLESETDATVGAWHEIRLCAESAAANAVIDSGERVMFCTTYNIPKTCYAVQYEAIVTESAGLAWMATTIVANRSGPPNSA